MAAKSGNLELCHYLVKDLKLSLNTHTNDQKNLFDYAIMSGNKEICNCVLDNKSFQPKSSKNKSMISGLFASVKNKISDSIKIFFRRLIHLMMMQKNKKRATSDNMMFQWACAYGRLTIAKRVYRLCPDNKKELMLSANNYKSFSWACYLNFKIVKWLYAVCPEDKKEEMLRGVNYEAFIDSCESGFLTISKWLYEVCPNQKTMAEMLKADDYAAFRYAAAMLNWRQHSGCIN